MWLVWMSIGCVIGMVIMGLIASGKTVDIETENMQLKQILDQH